MHIYSSLMGLLITGAGDQQTGDNDLCVVEVREPG